MSNLCLINQTHGTISEGSRLKSHILDCDTGVILCGSKSISGGFGADVNAEWLSNHTARDLMKNVCIKCLTKAIDIIEKELEE